MLKLTGPVGRLCDGPSRRELLQVGGVGLLGLTLPNLFALQSAQQLDKATPDPLPQLHPGGADQPHRVSQVPRRVQVVWFG